MCSDTLTIHQEDSVMSHRVLPVFLFPLSLLAGCAGGPFFDPSVVTDRRAPSPHVENGTAYDRATLDLRGVKKVVLPADATVHRKEPGESADLFMAKELGFAGHPGETMSVRKTRKKLGCATRKEGLTVLVATHGEWDSGIEGGEYLKLVAVIPDGIEVEQRPGLSKPVDAGRVWSGLSLPAEGWKAVTDFPDVNRSASK